MCTEYDERVEDSWNMSHGNSVVKMVGVEQLKDEDKKINTMLLHLGAFVLSNRKRIMNNFIQAVDRFYTNELYYGHTDSLFSE